MSRQLPSRPNLDHLRKQAKDLLGDIHKRNPGWKLADAQHATARPSPCQLVSNDRFGSRIMLPVACGSA